MWTIIFTTMLVSEHYAHAGTAVHVEQIGNYKSLNVCQKIANQLTGSKIPKSLGGLDSTTHMLTTTARCVQVKDPK